MSVLVKYLCIFGMAMLPIVELRGAVPMGLGMDLPIIPVLLVSILGNLVPVPFIILFIRKIFAWMKKKSEKLGNIARKMEERANKKGDVLVKNEILGLFILVAIPLPGTGAWTGALVATMFNLRMKNAIPAIFSGVVAAGIIMTTIYFTSSELFEMLF